MPHIYEGPTDARQSADLNEPVSRFRPKYRALEAHEIALHNDIKAKAAELEDLFEKIKPGRYSSLAMTSLEQAVMWAVKEITS